jgi:hypothetical protein
LSAAVSLTSSRPPGKRALSHAESELEWHFCSMHADLGISASGFEPATSGGESDICGSTIVRLGDWRHARAVKRAYVVGPKVARLTPELYADAEALYVPPAVPLTARDWFYCAEREHAQGIVTTVGLALRTAALAAAWVAATSRLAVAPSPLEWLSAEFLTPRRDRPRWCREVRAAAVEARERLLVAYVVGS